MTQYFVEIGMKFYASIWWSIALCGAVIWVPQRAFAQAERSIILPSERPSFVPKGYYWAEVADQRSSVGAVGRSVVQGRLVPAYIEGTPSVALGRWLRVAKSNTDSTLIPIRVVIKEWALSEKALSANKIEGKWQVHLAFERLYDERAILLTEYTGGVNYTRPSNSTVFLESTLSKLLVGSMAYFNNWVLQNATQHPSLAQYAEVVFLPSPSVSTGDTVFYEDRRISWSDFQRLPPPATRYGAAVYTSFGYEATSRRVGPALQIALRTKVFMIKSNSWARPAAKDDYALRHEQLHFDITKLVSERFKQKIKAEALPLDDYDSRIQYLFLESFREMNRTQQQYDAETNHSMVRSAQAQWIERIEHELRQFR